MYQSGEITSVSGFLTRVTDENQHQNLQPSSKSQVILDGDYALGAQISRVPLTVDEYCTTSKRVYIRLSSNLPKLAQLPKDAMTKTLMDCVDMIHIGPQTVCRWKSVNNGGVYFDRKLHLPILFPSDNDLEDFWKVYHSNNRKNTDQFVHAVGNAPIVGSNQNTGKGGGGGGGGRGGGKGGRDGGKGGKGGRGRGGGGGSMAAAAGTPMNSTSKNKKRQVAQLAKKVALAAAEQVKAADDERVAMAKELAATAAELATKNEEVAAANAARDEARWQRQASEQQQGRQQQFQEPLHSHAAQRQFMQPMQPPMTQQQLWQLQHQQHLMQQQQQQPHGYHMLENGGSGGGGHDHGGPNGN
jgi:hypothetical protein